MGPQLQEFNSKIAYHPGNLNSIADALTRNPAMQSLCANCSGPISLKSTNVQVTSDLPQLLGAADSTDMLAKKLAAWKAKRSVRDTSSAKGYFCELAWLVEWRCRRSQV